MAQTWYMSKQKGSTLCDHSHAWLMSHVDMKAGVNFALALDQSAYIGSENSNRHNILELKGMYCPTKSQNIELTTILRQRQAAHFHKQENV